MIYTFDAQRIITARLAVEAATADEAKKMVAAMPPLEHGDYPWVEEESIRLRAAYETWEGASAADGGMRPIRRIQGTISDVTILDSVL
jgi:hypothetical protein